MSPMKKIIFLITITLFNVISSFATENTSELVNDMSDISNKRGDVIIEKEDVLDAIFDVDSITHEYIYIVSDGNPSLQKDVLDSIANLVVYYNGGRKSYLPDEVKRVYFNSDLRGDVIENSTCTNSDNNVVRKENDTILVYLYDESKKELIISEKNKYMNCCNEVIGANSSIHNDTIQIGTYGYAKMEKEDGTVEYWFDPCNCICPFDITYKVSNVETKKYLVSIDLSDYIIDLSEAKEGAILKEYMVKGKFKSVSGCKNDIADEIESENEISNTEEVNASKTQLDTLVSYSFDLENHVGTIIAHNFTSQCCAKLTSNTSYQNDTILILTEDTSFLQCDCICKYDVTTELSGITKKTYHFNVDGRIFDLDLSQQTEGYIFRDTLPTGRLVGLKSYCQEESNSEENLKAITDTLISYFYNKEENEVTITFTESFNCCSYKYLETTYEGDTITANIEEVNAICKCLCPQEVTIIISGVKPQNYHFNLNSLSFDVDFSKEPFGVITE